MALLTWAVNSAEECHLHTVEVDGSNPLPPTIYCIAIRRLKWLSSNLKEFIFT